MDITLSGRGQFTLNKGLMEHLGVRPGEQVSINKMPDGRLEISARRDKLTVQDAKALFKKLIPNNQIHATIEEMNETIARCYAEAGAKGLE